MKISLGLTVSESSEFLYLWSQRDVSMPPSCCWPSWGVFPSVDSLLRSYNKPFSLLSIQPSIAGGSEASASDLHCVGSCCPACLPPLCFQVRVWSCFDFVTVRAATDHRTQSGLRVFSLLVDGKTSCLLRSILISHAFPVVSSSGPWLYAGAMTALTKWLSFCWSAGVLFATTLHISRNSTSFCSSLFSRRGCKGRVRCCSFLLP